MKFPPVRLGRLLVSTPERCAGGVLGLGLLAHLFFLGECLMREPFVGEVVAYHPGHDEGLGHAIRPALVTEFWRSGERSGVILSVFLTDGRVVPRVHPAHVLDSEPLAAYWDFLPAAS